MQCHNWIDIFLNLLKGLAKFEIIAMSQFKELESYCVITIGLIYFLTYGDVKIGLAKFEIIVTIPMNKLEISVTSQLDWYVF